MKKLQKYTGESDTVKQTANYALYKPSHEWKEGTSQHVTFILTEDCQLRCRYCYICGKNDHSKLSFDTAKAAVDYVLTHRKIFDKESVIWEFIGGEPLLEVELMDRICDYIKVQMCELNHPWYYEYRFSMATNGLFYSDSQVQHYIRKNAKNVSIAITIDGTKEKHNLQRIFPDGTGSYDAVVQQIPLWLSHYYGAHTKATIAHSDVHLVKDSVIHLWNLGIKKVSINCVFEDVWQEGDDIIFEKELIELANIIFDRTLWQEYQVTLFNRTLGFPIDSSVDNRNWCGTGKILAVDTKGNYFPCVRFAQYSLENKDGLKIGSIHEGIDPNKLRPFLSLSRTVQSPQKCIDCEVASGCAWCQGYNYDSADTDTIFQRATNICKMHKVRVRANNYLWNILDKIVPPPENDIRLRRLAQRKGLQSILLIADSAAPSFCHYPVSHDKTNERMTVETLKKVVYYALTNNLSLNVIVGNEPLSDEFRTTLYHRLLQIGLA